MKRVLLLRLATPCLVATMLAGAAAPPSSSVVVGAWPLDEIAPAAAVPPGASFRTTVGTNPLRAASDTKLTGAATIPGVSRAVYFPGWRRLVNGSVDATESALSTDPTLAFAAGSDGGTTTFDPGSSTFAVAVTVLPEPANDFPMAGRSTSAISPNIVQKGLTATTGGFWKLSLGMGGSGTSKYWYPFCTFKSGATELKVGYSGTIYKLAQSVPYRLGCLKSGATVTLRVSTPDGGSTLFTTSQTAPSDFTIDNNIAISVGHKPNSTDPADSYSGSISSLRIDKS